MYNTGVIAGSFDVIHPGYIYMFAEAKKICKHLTIALQTDPTFERKEKLKCILSVDERVKMLSSIRYIDNVCLYKTEQELYNLLSNNKFDVRILGNDYINKEITGKNLCKYIYYVERNHGWSTTKFKTMIYNSLENKYE